MRTTLTAKDCWLQDDLSTASAGTSQAPSAAVEKSAPRPLPNTWNIASRQRTSN